MRTCPRCKEEKSEEAFYVGRRGACKDCLKATHTAKQRVEPPTEGMKICTACGTDKPVSEYFARAASPDGLTPKCKPCKSLVDAAHYKTVRPKQIAQSLKWVRENREAYNINRRQRQRHREATDIQYKLKRRLRARLHKVIKSNVKTGSAVGLLGCPVDSLKTHLEASFYPHPVTGAAMTWDNYGAWHIDHIKPLANFDLTDHADLVVACHYTNLQPLWAEDNLSKGAT
jgi:hypothetical protein